MTGFSRHWLELRTLRPNPSFKRTCLRQSA